MREREEKERRLEKRIDERGSAKMSEEDEISRGMEEKLLMDSDENKDEDKEERKKRL